MQKTWTKKIKIISDVVIVELIKFIPLPSKRAEALLKLALSRAIKDDFGTIPKVILLGRLGNDPQAQYWIREVSIDLTD